MAAPDCAATGCGSACGARCWTRSSTAATTTCPRPTCGRAAAHGRHPRPLRPRGHGLDPTAATRSSSTPRRRDPRRGGEVLTSTPVRVVPVRATAARCGVVRRRPASGRTTTCVTTQLRPACDGMLSAELAGRSAPDPNRYLGVVCLVVRVRRSVSPYYALNITDRSRAAHERRGDHARRRPRARRRHLIYVPKLRRPRQPGARAALARDPPRVPRPRRADVPGLRAGRRPRLARSPAPGWPSRSTSWAARRPAPEDCLRGAGPGRRRPRRSVYPDLVNGQAVLGVAERLAEGLQVRLRAGAAEAQAA